MNIKNFLISEKMTIEEAVKKIDDNGYGVVYIVNERKLKGVVTDGDLRRYFLKNGNIKEKVEKIINYNCLSLPIYSIKQKKTFMKEKKILSLPIVDEQGVLLKVEFSDGKSAEYYNNLEIPTVIMAGGKGTRLYPYTEILPKPLIPIGKKTITEHIIERFEQYGCVETYMIVNYKKKLIKAYFQDTDNPHNVKFIEEEEFMGTGGGIGLLEGKVKETFFLTNCDIIINANYTEILEYHQKSKNILTMVCAEKCVQIPYGTIERDDNGQIVQMSEKPEFLFVTNTGFYVIEPEFFQEIPANTFVHITDVIQRCIENGKKIGSYIVSENDWLDMGQIEELEKMKAALEL